MRLHFFNSAVIANLKMDYSSGCLLLIRHKKCFVLLCPIGEQHLLSSFREFVHYGYWLDHGLSGSCIKEMHAVRKLSVWYELSISKYRLAEREIRHFHVVVVQWKAKKCTKSVMHVQNCCTGLSCQAIAFFTFSPPLHLKLPIIYDTLWSVRNRIFSVQIELLLLIALLIASETFFDSSVVSSLLVKKA